MATLDVSILQDNFSSGMVRDVAPHLIPQDGVYDITNGLIGDDDGSIFWRGGNENYSNADFGTGLRYIWTGFLTPGERTFFADATNFGVLNNVTPVNLGGDGLTAPTTAAEIEGLLFIGGGYIYGGSLKTASYTTTGSNTVLAASRTVTDATGGFTANVDAGMLMQNTTTGRLYVVESIESDTSLTLRDAYEETPTGTANVTFWNMYEITAADPYTASDNYAVSTARLFFHDDRNVYFTPLRTTAPQANPHTNALGDYHTVPRGARIVGLAAVGQLLLVFTTQGIWRLGGAAYNIVSEGGDPQHSFEQLSEDVLAEPAGIVGWEQYLVVPTTDGIHLIDGTSKPVRISKNIDPLYHDYMTLGYQLGGATIYKSRYFLPILGGSLGVRDVLVCRLDRAVRDRRRRVTFPWSHLAGSGALMAAYTVKNSESPRTPKLLGAEYADTARISDCSGYFDPGADNKTDADGTTPDFSITFRDFETGGLTVNRVRFARLGYELLADTGDDPHLILDYADGTRITDAPEWGHPDGEWGVGFGPSGTSEWAALSEGEFSPVMRAGVRDYASPATIEPHRFRVNRKFRNARFKLRGDNDPAEKCVIRRFELIIRPSQAVRR